MPIKSFAPHLSRLARCFAACAFLFFAACNSAPAKPASPVEIRLQPALVASELVLGQNRFAVGIIDPATGGPIKEGTVHFKYYDLSNPASPALESEADAARLTTPDGLTAIFVHERDFKRAGDWGVETTTRLPNGKISIARIQFVVLASSATKKIGDPAPNIETPIATDLSNDLPKLTSAAKPNPAFYKTSLAQALKNGKPTVLLFATPAFCQTRFCGPAYDVLSDLQPKYADAFNWIHVEVYTDLPSPNLSSPKYAPSMRAFGINTEPWIFIMDKTGTIVWRVEGIVTAEEIERRLKLLSGS